MTITYNKTTLGNATTAPSGISSAAWLAASAALSTDYPTTILGTTGLVAYWKLDETSGTSIADATGNGHTGTTHGAPTLNQTGAGTPGGASILFARASSQYISVPTISLANPYSIEAWVKPVNLSNEQTYVCKQGNNWHILQSGNIAHVVGGRTNSSGSGYVRYGNSGTGSWYYLVLTMDAMGNTYFWVNGSLVDARTIGTCANDTSVLGIGGDTSDSSWADAYIAHVAIYSVVLTVDQVRQHAQGVAASGAINGLPGSVLSKSMLGISSSGGGVSNYAF